MRNDIRDFFSFCYFFEFFSGTKQKVRAFVRFDPILDIVPNDVV